MRLCYIAEMYFYFAPDVNVYCKLDIQTELVSF